MDADLTPTQEIFKAHEAVAVVPTSGSRISLLMRRFFNVLLQHAQRQGDVEIYRVPLEQILVGADYTSTNLEVAKSALRSMAKTTVEWSTVRDDDDPSPKGSLWGVSALVAHAELIERQGRLHLEWSYSPKLRHNLLDPARYVKLSLQMYSTLRSSSAAGLYEICMRYLTNHEGLTNKAEWEWWRPRLTGIPEGEGDQIPKYKYFKRDTLLPAIREINAMTNIDVELHEYKTSRRITHIQFSSKLKAQAGLAMEEPMMFDSELLKQMTDLGLSESVAVRLYTSKEEENIRATLAYVQARVAKGGVESPAALFRDALKKGYGKTEAEKVSKLTPVKKSVKSSRSEEPKVAQPLDDIARAEAYIQGLSTQNMQELEKAFAATLGDTLVGGYYRKSGLRTKAVKAALLKYVRLNVLT